MYPRFSESVYKFHLADSLSWDDNLRQCDHRWIVMTRPPSYRNFGRPDCSPAVPLTVVLVAVLSWIGIPDGFWPEPLLDLTN